MTCLSGKVRIYTHTDLIPKPILSWSSGPGGGGGVRAGRMERRSPTFKELSIRWRSRNAHIEITQLNTGS